MKKRLKREKVSFDKGYFFRKAKKLVDDESKLREFSNLVQEWLSKGKDLPFLGDMLEEIMDMMSLLNDYIDGNYRDIPTGILVSIVAALLYTVSPINLVPDFIPIIGQLDDVALITLVLNQGAEIELEKYRKWKKKREKEREEAARLEAERNSHTERVTLTNMCFVYTEEAVLVQEKIDEEEKGIVFPGGHVEYGESITDSVVREIQEETGLLIEKPQLCGVKNWMEEDGSRYIVFLYKTDQFSGELKASEEGRVFWASWEELENLEFIWNTKELLSIFRKGEFSEYFWASQGEEGVLK